MAQPIQFEPRKWDQHQAQRLESALEKHTEALISTMETLQVLHDEGVLELLGRLTAGRGWTLQFIVNAANSLGAVRSIRNLLILTEALSTIDPWLLHEVVAVMPDLLAVASKCRRVEPPSL